MVTPPFSLLSKIIVLIEPFVRLERQRESLMAQLFAGVLNRPDIDLSGAPQEFAWRFIQSLYEFGEIYTGKTALQLLLLDVIYHQVGSDRQLEIVQLTNELENLDEPTSASSLGTPSVTISTKTSKDSTLPSVFISYARTEYDTKIADQVQEYLRNNGVQVWRDTSISVGEDWDEAIERALKWCDRMVLLLSSSSMPYRKEVKREWFYFDQRKKPIHPLYIEKCELHSRLLAYNYIDARDDLASSISALLAQLNEPFSAPTPLSNKDIVSVIRESDNSSLAQKLDEIRGAIKNEQLVSIGESQLEELLSCKPKSLEEYRLIRVCEWSQTRYQLDNRFIHLSLLVDLGEDFPGARWSRRLEESQFTDLRDVLKEVSDSVLVLLGPPGSGKSTLLRRLELDTSVEGMRGNTDTITLFAHLNHYDGALSPREWLSRVWRDRNPDLNPFDQVLASRHLLLLLDGLNELPHKNEDDYRRVISLWRNFLYEAIGDLPGNRAIITCRSLDYSAPLSSPSLKVPQIRIERLDDSQIQAFLQVYLPNKAAEVWQSIQRNAQMDLFRLPFFINLLITYIDNSRSVPNGYAELFSGFVHEAIMREIEAGNPLFSREHVMSSREYKRLLLTRDYAHNSPFSITNLKMNLRFSDLAYAMQSFSPGHGTALVTVAYEDAQKIIGHGSEDIIKAGTDINILEDEVIYGTIKFYHQLFQEYFAALKLAQTQDLTLVQVEWEKARVNPSLAEVIVHLAESDPLPPPNTTGWEETTIIGSSLTDNPTSFIEKILHENLALAGRCASTPGVNISSELRITLQTSLLHRMHDNEADLRSRIEAGLVLGYLGDPRFEPRAGQYGKYLMQSMVKIEANTYPIGDADAFGPRHFVSLDSFLLAPFPVTNGEYKLFMDAGGYEDTRWWQLSDAEAWRAGAMDVDGARREYGERRELIRENPNILDHWVATKYFTVEYAREWSDYAEMTDREWQQFIDENFLSGQRYRKPKFWNDDAFNAPNQPVIGVTWYEAVAYCNWLSAQTGLMIQLPSEVQIEAAGAGVEGRIYAYGNIFDAFKGNVYETHIRRTTPVGLFVEGRTPEGIYDICSNAFVWTSSLWGERGEATFTYPYNPNDGREEQHSSSTIRRVIRSGTWNSSERFSRCSHRFRSSPASRGIRNGFGFRISAQI